MESLFHAYMIGGPRAHARAHIDAVLAQAGFSRAGNPDCIAIECVTFSIDNARELKAWQELVPERGAHKAYIVYADFINREAQHALLKTLEEPIPGTHIFFSVPNPEMLLPTILSRVRVVTASGENENDGSAARKFIALSRADRLSHIAKLMEKGEDEEAAALVRERALALMNALEEELEKDPRKHGAKLEAILKLKKYLYTSGASSRMILETIALAI